MKSRKANAEAERQRVAEIEWLINAAGTEWHPRRDTPGAARVDCRMLPALVSPELATRIEEILFRPELVPLLSIIERHNSQPPENSGNGWIEGAAGREGPMPERRAPQKGNFLLGPHLFQVLVSVRSRNELRQRLPAFDQPAAELREHLQKVGAECKALAKLIRQGPQPHVALAAKTNAAETLSVFVPWTALFEASDDAERQLVAFTELLERASGWFGVIAHRVQRARQNRRPAGTPVCAEAAELRTRAAEFLSDVFRKRLGHPYRAHVATIAAIVSGIVETDKDFVRKVDRRHSNPDRGQNRPENHRNRPPS